MTRLLIALAIAALSSVMAWSLVRDAHRRRGADVPVPPVARASGAPPRDAGPGPAPEPIESARSPEPQAFVEHPLSEALCLADMVLVEAPACAAVRKVCAAPDAGPGCAPAPDRGACRGPTKHLSFCIDRHEYPNVPGVLPAMMLTFEMAESACHHEGKRLCTDDEWTLACEGTRRTFFSTGAAQGAGGCNAGPGAARIPVERLWNAEALAGLLERYDRRVRSGARRGCISEFAVTDLTGNVAEWVRVSAEEPFPGGLKGGDFSSAPVTCRAVRRIRAAHYAAFGVGARCCADPAVPVPRAP
jgi:formylglycine-generating enzyme